MNLETSGAMEQEERKNSEQLSGENEENSAAAAVNNDVGELRQPIWSVLSFERCAAKDLTYAEALEKIAELEKQNVSGLCIVTNDVADRFAKRG